MGVRLDTTSMHKGETNMTLKKIRNMKVYEQPGYRYKSTPIIMRQWLNEIRFGYGTHICVECNGGKLLITRVDEIEATFTEVQVQCVAEADAEYGKKRR